MKIISIPCEAMGIVANKKSNKMRTIEDYKKIFFLGLLMIALGIICTTVFEETFGSLGNVLVAVGGLFFVIAMNKKKKSGKEE